MKRRRDLSQSKPGESAEQVHRSLNRRPTSRRAAVFPIAVAVAALGGLVYFVGVERALVVFLIGSLLFGPILFKNVRRHQRSSKRWRAGAAGEKRTAKLLTQLRKQGWTIVHDLAVPGSKANVDHLAISSKGVVVIDSKQWRERWQGNKRSGWYYRDKPVDDVARVTGWIVTQVEGIVAKSGASVRVPVYAVWVMHGKPPARRFTLNNGVHVVTGDNLAPLLEEFPEALDARDVTKVRKAVVDRMKTAVR